MIDPLLPHIILGGGIIGLSIAYYLCKSDQPCIIIEQTAVNSSASGKSGGFLAKTWQDHMCTESLCQRSYQLHQQLAGEINGTLRYDYRNCNTYSIKLKQLYTDNTDIQYATPNAPIQAPSKQQLLPDWCNGNIQSYSNIGNAFNTSQITPSKFCDTLVDEIQRMGGKIIIDTIQHINLDSNNIVQSIQLQSNHQFISCSTLTIACGSWSSNKLLSSIYSTLPNITGSKAHSIILKPNNNNNNNNITDNTMLFIDYTDIHHKSTDPEIYPRSDGSIYICGASDSTLLPDTSASVHSDELVAESLYSVGCHVSSIIRDHYYISVSQACYLPTTDDGFPIIGRLSAYDNTYICTGHTCWGMNNSLGSGLAIAQLITTGNTDIDISELTPDRFQ